MPGHGGTLMKLLILVVDDEPDVEMLFRQQFRRDLRLGRFTMACARSGEAALRRINDAAGVSIILILSDINMPGMTGLELLPKAKVARPDVPVIMITAYGDAETKRKALEGGAEALFTKPIDFGALRGENRHARREGRLTKQHPDLTDRSVYCWPLADICFALPMSLFTPESGHLPLRHPLMAKSGLSLQLSVKQRDNLRALTDSGSDALHRAGTNVANRKDTLSTGFQ